MKKKENLKVCKTCGTPNNIHEEYCHVCQRRLEGAPIRRSLPTEKLVVQDDSRKEKVTKVLEDVPSPRGRRRWLVMPIMLLLIILLLVLVIPRFPIKFGSAGTIRPTVKPATVVAGVRLSLPNGLGVITAPNGESIGINDGSFLPFDVGRKDSEVKLKQEAAQKLSDDNAQGAMSLWREAQGEENNDAEALIYLEDQRILANGSPYITLVVGAAFVKPFPDASSQSALQGIYVAQHEFNTGSSPVKLRLLIANSGSPLEYVAPVAQQIVKLASQDTTLVGVIGWLTSSRTLTALHILSDAKIPILSQTASSDELSGISSYFFRIVPPNKVQGEVAAMFAASVLHAMRAVVFVDPTDSYSQSIAQDFAIQFTKEGNTVLKKEEFTTGKTKSFAKVIGEALNMNGKPDVLYFAGANNTDTELFQDALPTSGLFAKIPVIAGDAGYVIHKNSYNRWYFTTFAYPDEWDVEMGSGKPAFFQDYSDDFNPNSKYPPGFYGYTRADSTAILSYDAVAVLEEAIKMALTNGKTKPTALDIANILPQITSNHAFQGIGGQIAFDANHDPINKAIVVLYSSDGHIQMKSVQGCFRVGCPANG